jgi:hypothetical protein
VRATGAAPRGRKSRQEMRINLELPILLGGDVTARNTLFRPRAADTEHRDPIREVSAHHMAHAPVFCTTSSRDLPRAAAGSVSHRVYCGKFRSPVTKGATDSSSNSIDMVDILSCSPWCYRGSRRGRLLLRREVCSITPFPIYSIGYLSLLLLRVNPIG